LPLSQYTSYLEGTYRSGNEFRTLSNIRLLLAITTALTLVLPWKFGFRGYCGQVFILSLQPAVLGYIFRPVRVGPRFEPGYLRLLYATGWRLHLWNYLSRTAQSFPRLALATIGGTLALGLYVPVQAAYIAINNVTGSLSAYLYPSLTRHYAVTGAPVGRIALRSGLLVMLGLTPGVILGAIALPLVVPRFLPDYARAVVPAQIVLFAGLFECISIGTNAFAATKAWTPMFIQLAASLVVRGTTAFIGAIAFEDRLFGVALGMLIASVIMAFVTQSTVAGRISRPARTSSDPSQAAHARTPASMSDTVAQPLPSQPGAASFPDQTT
jgi:hypothetical protein